ncbi:MAG TPA: hypothetical protein VM122_01580, partial [Usitatibacter sp.]|nr:hypothetical protein [Usitatibacter sp.]
AAAASRVMSLAIALLSLAIAGLAAARHVVPELGKSLDGWGVLLGFAVVAIVAVAYRVAMRLGARELPPSRA